MVRVVYGNGAYQSIWEGTSEGSFGSHRAHELRVGVVEHGIKRLCAGDLPEGLRSSLEFLSLPPSLLRSRDHRLIGPGTGPHRICEKGFFT
jgi:hypothetical protein